MNKVILRMLKQLENGSRYGITIPELHLEIEIKDKFIAAYALSLLCDDYDFDPVEFDPIPYDSELIQEIIAKIEMIEQKNIRFIGLYGERAEAAFAFFEERFRNKIVNNDDCKVVNNHDFILCPIIAETYEGQDLETLSLLDVSVIDFNGTYNELYSHGTRIESAHFEALAYIAYANAHGWLIQDYVFAEMLYCIKKISKTAFNTILSNTTTPFVQSLVSIMAEPYFRDIHTLWFKSSDVSILCNMLEEYDFNQIKDYLFQFVKRYMYEQKKTR